MTETTYGVWNFSERDWEESDLDYDNCMGLALFCCDNDDYGVKNFAVVKCELQEDGNMAPVWHIMPWCGGFQGYEYLYNHCTCIDQISGDTPHSVNTN